MPFARAHSLSVHFQICELDAKAEKSAMRRDLAAALARVAVPALPPLLLCGVGFSQQAWTARVLAERDHAAKEAEREAVEREQEVSAAGFGLLAML